MAAVLGEVVQYPAPPSDGTNQYCPDGHALELDEFTHAEPFQYCPEGQLVLQYPVPPPGGIYQDCPEAQVVDG